MKDYNNLQNLYFLGPKGEQRKFFQDMIELINNDMIFWRRNFHPKDSPTIPYSHLTSPIGQSFQDHFMQSLIQLLAELKTDMPFFSPRYIAHMTGDMTLPGIVGYYAGLLYHSNNVSAEASSATLKYELSVAKDFSKLFGYDHENSFGHITSGGTVANLESVFYFKATRFIPAIMALAIKTEHLPWPDFLNQDLWSLLNTPLEQLPQLISKFKTYCSVHQKNYATLINTYSLATLGDQVFWEQLRIYFNQKIGLPVIIVPSNAHYCWSKASHLFGIGRKQCLQVQMNSQLTMSMEHLKTILAECEKNKNPIIQLVCVLGSTEFGTFDNLPEIIKIKQSSSIYFPIHIDAAYGGYFKSIFEQGKQFPSIATQAQNTYPTIFKIFNETKNTDSITVDPHKLGSTPYGAGVFLTKHGFSKDYVAEEAAYCLSQDQQSESDFPLGKYIIEGSKPGASAASVYFSNKIIPLNSDGYGGLIWDFCQVANEFYHLIAQTNQTQDQFSKEFHIQVITPPQSNIICFYIKPNKLTNLNQLNNFTESLVYDFFPRETDHIQNFKFIVSKTKLYFSKFNEEDKCTIIPNIEINDDYLLLFRLVFMNRWFTQENSPGKNYMNEFIDEIKKVCCRKL